MQIPCQFYWHDICIFRPFNNGILNGQNFGSYGYTWLGFWPVKSPCFDRSKYWSICWHDVCIFGHPNIWILNGQNYVICKNFDGHFGHPKIWILGVKTASKFWRFGVPICPPVGLAPYAERDRPPWKKKFFCTHHGCCTLSFAHRSQNFFWVTLDAGLQSRRVRARASACIRKNFWE